MSMEGPYTQQSQPPPSQPAYTMAPGPPSAMSTNDASYRREPPPPSPSYHAQAPPQHPQNGQQYPYNPNALPSLSSRTPLPDQLLVSENGGASATTLPAPGSMEQMVEGTQPPPSHSMVELGRRYTLDVVQQPKRARMCGFGDKDRRPITPPPCIRLIITDAVTGIEIDTNDIDYGLFVINVDLWSADGLREVNLVRHSASSPAISSTTPTSYGQTQVLGTPVYNTPLPTPAGHSNIARDPQYPYHLNQSASHPTPNNQNQAPYNPYPHQPQVNPYGQGNHQQNQVPAHPQSHYAQSQYQQQGQGYAARPPSPSYNQPGRYQEPPNHHVYFHTGSSVHAMSANSPRPGDPTYNPTDPNMNRMSVSAPIPNATGMYTRNLIGSLSASAFRLTDPNDKNGIWFVLQDLSVRTEGNFRLRFSFVNVGAPSKTPNGNASNQVSVVNVGKAPILASCYSEVFTVYSAKKFPGVVESTPLSKCFATQGIKIPIRKDGPSKLTNRDEYDED